MVTILSFCLMLIVIAESRTTLTDAFQSNVVCNQVVGAKAGDDCTKISQKFKMSLDLFLVINPNINCKAIFVGQWLCVAGTATN
ncbi:hypothetical protein QVD17_19885 [Tagetes erecta]|uniref:LysM domain-containing protein n=1 Tax=Tagetes erecta TaxID=13708 RepID=A0AAD8KN47_TARER|nr:hypothetical protein QVD17_19885 [Tagetes erecta]